MKTSLLSGETPESKQAQVFKTIQQKSGLNQRQVRAQYEEFMKICPNGTMTKKKFVELSKEALGSKSDFLSDALFRVFDEDNSGTMDFAEYMLAINATSLESPEEKLKWMFDVIGWTHNYVIGPVYVILSCDWSGGWR